MFEWEVYGLIDVSGYRPQLGNVSAKTRTEAYQKAYDLYGRDNVTGVYLKEGSEQ